MAVARTRTIRSGDGEIVLLPAEIAYAEGVELTLEKAGDVLTIYPTRPSIAEIVAELRRLPKPSSVEVRDTELLPEPKNL